MGGRRRTGGPQGAKAVSEPGKENSQKGLVEGEGPCCPRGQDSPSPSLPTRGTCHPSPFGQRKLRFAQRLAGPLLPGVTSGSSPLS